MIVYAYLTREDKILSITLLQETTVTSGQALTQIYYARRLPRIRKPQHFIDIQHYTTILRQKRYKYQSLQLDPTLKKNKHFCDNKSIKRLQGDSTSQTGQYRSQNNNKRLVSSQKTSSKTSAIHIFRFCNKRPLPGYIYFIDVIYINIAPPFISLHHIATICQVII